MKIEHAKKLLENLNHDISISFDISLDKVEEEIQKLKSMGFCVFLRKSVSGQEIVIVDCKQKNLNQNA